MRIIYILKRVIKAFSLFFKYSRIFGIKAAIWMCYVYILPSQKGKRYMSFLQAFFENQCNELIERYKNNFCETNTFQKNESIPIWTCWWSGYESMPEVVKLCYEQLKRMAPNNISEVILITLDNYKEFINIPEYIENKFRIGIISAAHFSDILRFSLLSKYGGMWLDSTIFVSGKIPNEYINTYYFTQKVSDRNKFPKEPSRAQWCGFIWSGKSGNPLFTFIRDALYTYWREYDIAIDYIFFDYIILAAYNNVPMIRRMMDLQEPNNEDVWAMLSIMNKEYNEQVYLRICAHNIFHKLTYKVDFEKITKDEKDTLYGYLLKETNNAC